MTDEHSIIITGKEYENLLSIVRAINERKTILHLSSSGNFLNEWYISEDDKEGNIAHEKIKEMQSIIDSLRKKLKPSFFERIFYR